MGLDKGFHQVKMMGKAKKQKDNPISSIYQSRTTEDTRTFKPSGGKN